jgi:hypothetical protein
MHAPSGNLAHNWLHVTSYRFFLPCIIVYQYSETNVMHFLFSVLRNKGLYMFRTLRAHPQEALKQTASGILRVCYVN